MHLAVLLAAQAAIPTGNDAASLAAFDLSDVTPSRECRSADAQEILVCGRARHDDQRIRPLPDESYREPPLRAEISLGRDFVASATVDQKEFPGAISKRLMINLTAPLSSLLDIVSGRSDAE